MLPSMGLGSIIAPIQSEFQTGCKVAVTRSSYTKVFDVYWTVHHCDN